MSHAGATVITGMGAAASIGVGLDAFWSGIAAGRTGIRAALRFSTQAYGVSLGASLDAAALPPGTLDRDPDSESDLDPCAALAIVAAREALDRSGIARASLPPDRLAIVMGTSAGGLHARSAYELTDPRERARRHRLLERSGFHTQTAAVAAALGLDGPRLTISTACASSTHALAHARDLLRSGLADAVIAGGVDLLIEETFAGFHAMGAISPAPCAPFSLPVGMSVGEGAGFVVLERLDDATRRGQEPLAAVLGAGSSADGHHPTAPDPTGIGIARALRAALDDAGVTPAEIGYFNAHGTGTEANDLAEWRALQRVFGAGVDALPVSSTKSYLGHTLGAAGILEIIATVLAMRRSLLPPTLGFTTSRGHGPADLIAEAAPRPARIRYALKSSSAFGGANGAVVLGREAPVITAPTRPAAVVILGASAVAAHGFEGLDEALRRGVPLWKNVEAEGSLVALPPVAARVPPIPLSRLVRGVDPRGMDTITRFLTTAAALALADAGLVVRGPLRERVGLIVGAGRLPWDSADAFWGSIRARGFSRLSAPAFSRIVMNAAAGAAARTLSLLGPTSLLAGGPLGGLQALITAADMLAHRDDAEALVAGTADELGAGMLADHAFSHPDAGREGLPFPLYDAPHEAPVRGEGAACFVLARASSTLTTGKNIRAHVAGAGLSGPRGLDVAIRLALQSAEISPSEVDAVYGSADGLVASGRAELDALRAVFGPALARIPLANPATILGACESLSALTTAAAIEALRTGRAHPLAGASPPVGLEQGTSTPRPVRTVLIAGWLTANGIEPGAAMATLLPNGRPLVTALFGALLAGVVVVPLDPRLRAPEIRFLAQHCRCCAVITGTVMNPPLALASCPEIAYHDALSAATADAGAARRALDPAVILATSGSTAAPKAVVLSHENLLTNQRSVGDLYGFGPEDVFLTALSLFHSFGLTACLLAAVDRGASVITTLDAQPARLAALASRHDAMVFFATASLYPYLVRGTAPAGSFRTVRCFLSGAAPLSEATALAFRARFGQDILQTYGLTEASPVVTANPPGDNRPGTIGPALPGVALRVVDDELQVQGATVMIGYLDNPSATAACLSEDGWLATGDLARIDAEGYVTLLGRKKDLIVRGGEKIFPEELEEALRRHPDVADAAVVGLADPAFEEVPVAFIVPREPGAPLDAASLDAHCRRELALFKVPRRYLAIDTLPRNPNGKLLKRELRECLAQVPVKA